MQVHKEVQVGNDQEKAQSEKRFPYVALLNCFNIKIKVSNGHEMA